MESRYLKTTDDLDGRTYRFVAGQPFTTSIAGLAPSLSF